MNIHEYQAKGLLAQYGIPVPQGGLAETAAAARAVAQGLPGPVWVVKAQIHAGGRGKGGGVQVCKSLDEVEQAAGRIIGMQLVTHQTGPEGKKVRKVWVEQGTIIERELYLVVVLDRGAQCLTVMASPDGGMDIEAVAEKTPERIFTTRLDGGHHIWPFQARDLLFGCGLTHQAGGRGSGPGAQPGPAGRGEGRHPGGDQSPGRDRRWPHRGPGRQDELRRERIHAQSGRGRHGRPRGVRSPGAQGPGPGRQLRAPARLRGHHGQRRWPGHGHHGRHQAGRGRTGQLPGRGRRSQCADRGRGLRADALGPQRARHPDQYFRGHPALRHPWPRAWWTRPGRSTSPCRWWCAWKAPTWRKAVASCGKAGMRFETATSMAEAAHKIAEITRAAQ